MSMKLLPASVNPVDPSPDESASLVLLTPKAVITRAGQISLVPPAGAFARSSSTPRGDANRIDGTLVEDSQSDDTSGSVYVSAWDWRRPVENTAVAQYLSYAADLVGWSGRLIDLYA